MKLIDLYKEWIETECIPKSGLCYSVPDKYQKNLELFRPTGASPDEYWASDISKWDNEFKCFFEFNPLRQTIVCFLMAMHNEI